MFTEHTNLTELYSQLLSDIRNSIVFGRYAEFAHMSFAQQKRVYESDLKTKINLRYT
jgi:hypothetical protein